MANRTRCSQLPPLPQLTRTNASPPSPRKQIVIDVFNMFDTDGSGEIELEEMAKAFKATGKLTDETRAQLEAHFEFMDSDGSGEVTIDEFREALGHGEIAFRNYQHQQAFYSLGLTLCQNLVVYRKHVLNQEFESMKQQPPGSAVGGLEDQFDCLVRSLMMSTFALKGGDSGGGNDKGKGGGGHEEQWSQRRGCSKYASKTLKGSDDQARNNELLRKREARVLAHALKVGQTRRKLRPLPASRGQHLRAVVRKEVADIWTRRENHGEQRGLQASPHRRPLKKLPQKMAPTKPRARGPTPTCRHPPR
ncbi:unnamed protein product [Ectocarpus sp. CCAP 1310/34]|nr:unnamed protein product [Ectocarpus sp. CCAP 1310/34]